MLIGIVQGTMWRDFWEHLNIHVFSFDELELRADASDVRVWRTCQERQIVLVTGNRNKRGRDSLEATLLRENDATKLPVFTLSNARRVLRSTTHAAAVAEKMLVYLLDIERLRGAGRLYLP